MTFKRRVPLQKQIKFGNTFIQKMNHIINNQIDKYYINFVIKMEMIINTLKDWEKE